MSINQNLIFGLEYILIRIIFSLYGFNNALVFKNIESHHLDEITESIRTEPEVVLNTGEDLTKLFGKHFAADLRKFQFRSGDKLLIMEMVVYVKNIVSTNGLDFFQENKKELTESEPIQVMRIETNNIKETKAQFLLKRLLANADRNKNRKQQGHRYDDIDKLYASYLRIIIGPMAYETLYRNLEGALPSLPSANRYVRASNCHMTEGIPRFEELSVYLKKREQPLLVSLSEDATRIVGKIQYDSISNQLVGFVLPTNVQNGMPTPFKYPANDAVQIINHFSSGNSTASFINVIMAQPLGGAPPFCLLLYGSDNRYGADDVKKRWLYVTSELNRLGISVLTFSSDSDPKYNSAMRELSTIGTKNDKFKWFSSKLDCAPPFYVQDIIHIATKLRNFLLRLLRRNCSKYQFPFGQFYIRIQHLNELVERFPKQHGLTASTLNPNDRQNFTSVERMYDQRVIDLLRNHIKDSQGTIQFLQMIRDIVSSFKDRNLTPLQRIRKIWYPLFLIRIWREFIINRKNTTLKDNFLSMNCYSCIEMNAHSLIQIILHLRKIDKPELFLPYLFESQPCEAIFRQFRSMSSTYSTVTNCTVKEANSRISKIQLQNEIMHVTSSDFVYPRLVKKIENKQTVHSLPSAEEIYNEIVFCEKLAITTATKLGLIRKGTDTQNKFVCRINMHSISNNRIVRKKHRSPTNDDKNSYTLPDIKNIQLKDYTGKYAHEVVDETSPFVEMYNVTGRRTLVKKTSLCWLLRGESQKLSSDRLQRVQYTAKKSSTGTILTKHRTKRCTKY